MNPLTEDLNKIMSDPQNWSDDEIERQAREILAGYPPEDDDPLMAKVRAILARRDAERDREPTVIRMNK
jgi:hypothetical protein